MRSSVCRSLREETCPDTRLTAGPQLAGTKYHRTINRLCHEKICHRTTLTKKNGARGVGRALEWTPGFLRFD